MKVGDIVKTCGQLLRDGTQDWIGVIIEIVHCNVEYPDYRTPSTMRVFFPINNTIELCYKSELRMISEGW